MAQILTDYTIDVPDPGKMFLQGVQVARQQRQQQAMKAAMQDYMADPTPQKLANLHLNFPALKDRLNAYQQTLSDADKRTTIDFATQALGLNMAGKTDDVVSLFDQYISGAESGNRLGVAQAMKDAKRVYLAIDDPVQREAMLGAVLGGTGKEGLDLYEKVFASGGGGDKEYDLNVRLFGKQTADNLRLAQQVQKGTVAVSGPAGSSFKFMGGPIPSAAAAATATVMPTETPAQNAAALDFMAAKGAINSMGREGAGAFFKRNNFAVKVNTPTEAKQLPSGTAIILPDGTEGVVP